MDNVNNMEVEENELEAPLLSVLKIDVIMRNLEKFLTVKDLGKMRVVNRAMNGIVLCQTKFLSRCKIVLKESMYADPCLKTLSFQPKKVAIHVFKVEDDETEDEDLKKQEIVDVVCKLVEQSEFIQIAGEGGMYWYFYNLEKDYPDGDYDDVSLPKHFPPILEVIACVKALKELKLDYGAPLFFSNARDKHAEALAGIHTIDVDSSFPCYCPRIFLKLRGLSRIHGFTPSDDQPPEQYKRCRALQMNNMAALTELDLMGQPLRFCSKYFEKVFPSLKSLRLDAGKEEEGDGGSSVITFLENHIDQLEDLNIWVSNPEADKVLNTVSKCKKRIKDLLLMLETDVKKTSFLECMEKMRNTSLESFEVRTFWHQGGEGTTGAPVDIFALPLPMSLRSLTIGSKSGMYYDPSKLKRFPALTRLELDEFIGPLNSILKGICKHLRKLNFLQINCDDEAAASLFIESGESENGSNNSTAGPDETFANLQDLESLNVFNGPDLPTDIINGIKCQKLRSLSVANLPDTLCALLSGDASLRLLISTILQALDLGIISLIFRESPGLKEIHCGPNFREFKRTDCVVSGLEN